MSLPNVIKICAAVAMTGLAVYFFIGYLRDDGGISPKGFFYDESAKKLFAAPRTSIPPIRGTDGPAEDAVGAVVISMTGEPADKKSWQIAYLEKYSPELKKEMEQAQSTGTPPPMGRGMAQAHRFVRRLADTNWFSLTSPVGEQIVTEWATPGPNGIVPVVCTP